MKLTSKRLVSILICLAMVLAVLPVMAIAAEDNITVYVSIDSESAPYAWAWGEYGNAFSSWPGVTMEQDGEWWKIQVPTGTTGFIANNGSGTQTANILIDGQRDVWITVSADYGQYEVSYDGGETVVEPEFLGYFVAGVAELCGEAWNPSAEANKMTEAGDGLWTMVYENVAAGEYKLKVTDGTWTNCWGDPNGSDPEGNYVFSVESDSTVTVNFDSVNYVVTVNVVPNEAETPVVPDPETPAEGNVIAEGSETFDDDSAAYTGISTIYTAAADGTVTVEISDCTPGYMVSVYNVDAGELVEEFANSVAETVSFDVVSGTTYDIIIGSCTYYSATLKLATAGSVSYKITATAAGSEGEEPEVPDVPVVTEPGDTQDNPKEIGGNTWIYIEAGKTMWFLFDNYDNMINNGVYSQMLNINASTDYAVTYKEMDVPVDADGYVNYEMMDMTMMGSYVFSVTNNGTEKAFFTITVSDKPEYINTYMSVELGDTTVSLDSVATYTLYEFEPTETGTYIISIPADAGVIGDWGASFFPQDKTENKTNTLEWTCTSVGQSLLIGIDSDAESVVLTIEKQGEYVPEPEVEWTIVENVELDVVIDMVYSEEDYVAIDVTDDVADDIYEVGGLFHYGSPEGPIVVANLKDSTLINILDAYGYGQLKYVVEDGDEIIAKYDCNEAMLEYYNAGIVPLTYELYDMLYNIGCDKGWYDPEVPGFYLWKDIEGNVTAEVDPDYAFLAFCGYIEGSDLVADKDGTVVENTFETDGDISETVVLYPAEDGTVTIEILSADPGFLYYAYANNVDGYENVAYNEGDGADTFTFNVVGGNVYDIYLAAAEYVESYEGYISTAGTISYKITYTAGSGEPDVPAEPSPYYVAGVSGLCGSEWNPADAANNMVLGEDGKYYLTYEDVAAGEYKLKVTDGTWDNCWGDPENGDADGNLVFTVDETADVTVIFDAESKTVSVLVGGEESPSTGDMGLAAVVVALMAATAGAVVIGKKKEF